MHLLIFLGICTTAIIVAASLEENRKNAQQLHHDRIDKLCDRHISVDQVLAEIMDKV